MCNSHVLLEGVPGTAKTMITKSMAEIISCSYGRIQFTPDLLPADIVGTMIYNVKSRQFEVRKGPIFANFILADEINRAPPKTQAALLECMQESQVTIEGATYHMKPPFIVVATQNPVDMEGTYALPEAQLDRFIFKSKLSYPLADDEFNMLKMKNMPDVRLNSVLNLSEISKLIEIKDNVVIDDSILKYVVELNTKIRQNPDVELGPGPRASIAFLQGSKARAAIDGRNYVIPDDIKALCNPILRHRIRLKPEAQISGIQVENVIAKALGSITTPKVAKK